MKRSILTITLFLSAISYTLAQEQLSIKQQADRLFDRYEYFKSLSYYLKLIHKKTDLKVLERIADCYRNINQYDDAEEWYAKAIADAKASKAAHYNYAEVLLRNQKLDEAKQQYQLSITNNPGLLNLKLSNCDSAMVWMKQAPHYAINNMSGLNSIYSDWGANTIGKTSIIFTSDRDAEEPSTDNRTGNNWFKLYQTNLSSGQTKQLLITDTNGNHLPNNYHSGPIALNATGDTAYITITTEIVLSKLTLDKADQKLSTRRLQLVIAAKNKEQWAVFDTFKYNDIQKYSIGNACLSPNGKVLYFSSDMPGGEGKTDIWYCDKQADGYWAKPINCGKTINTSQEDNFPYIAANGTLYYSSKGLPGIGGYDVYAAKGEKVNWSTPQNLKYPINTTSDDFYLITQDGSSGYLSSNREGGKGSDDIYTFVAIADTLPSKPIVDVASLTPKINTPEPKPILAIGNIYYDLDKSFIRTDAITLLDKLVDVLKQHPNLNIELSSYTDSRASFAYNMALSNRRAKAALTYLIKNDIAANRIAAKGYGETHPVNQCFGKTYCTEAEYQLNRRTEFKLTQYQ